MTAINMTVRLTRHSESLDDSTRKFIESMSCGKANLVEVFIHILTPLKIDMCIDILMLCLVQSVILVGDFECWESQEN